MQHEYGVLIRVGRLFIEGTYNEVSQWLNQDDEYQGVTIHHRLNN